MLRRFTAADEANLVSLNSDPEVMRYITGGRPTSREQIRDEIMPFHLAAYAKHPGFGTWAADDIGTGQFLGWFHPRPRRSDGVIDLGYRLRRPAWGNGYATEGSRALIDKGFTEAWPVSLYPVRFRSDEARMKVLGRTAGILGELGVAVRANSAPTRMPPKPGPR